MITGCGRRRRPARAGRSAASPGRRTGRYRQPRRRASAVAAEPLDDPRPGLRHDPHAPERHDQHEERQHSEYDELRQSLANPSFQSVTSAVAPRISITCPLSGLMTRRRRRRARSRPRPRSARSPPPRCWRSARPRSRPCHTSAAVPGADLRRHAPVRARERAQGEQQQNRDQAGRRRASGTNQHPGRADHGGDGGSHRERPRGRSPPWRSHRCRRAPPIRAIPANLPLTPMVPGAISGPPRRRPRSTGRSAIRPVRLDRRCTPGRRRSGHPACGARVVPVEHRARRGMSDRAHAAEHRCRVRSASRRRSGAS